MYNNNFQGKQHINSDTEGHFSALIYVAETPMKSVDLNCIRDRKVCLCNHVAASWDTPSICSSSNIYRENNKQDCLLPLFLTFCTELQPLDQQSLKGLFLHCCPWWLHYKAPKISSSPGSKTCTFPHHASSCQPVKGAATSVGRPGDLWPCRFFCSSLWYSACICVGREKREFITWIFSHLEDNIWQCNRKIAMHYVMANWCQKLVGKLDIVDQIWSQLYCYECKDT